ncbi:MAG: MauE/DoxX family redox-associated membrane protein [Planctomycetota bacterium]
MSLWRVVPHAAAGVVAVVFVVAGSGKAIDPAGFAEAIERYALLPGGWVPWVAFYLPWLEIVAGLALVWTRTRGAAAWLIAGMLVVMTGALGSAWWRGLDITCGCFGNWWELSAGWAAVRNVGLIGALAWSSRFSGDAIRLKENETAVAG